MRHADDGVHRRADFMRHVGEEIRLELGRFLCHLLGAMQFGDVTIDTRSQQLTIGTSRLTIPRREFELLHQLASFPGRVFSREELIEHVWGRDFMGDDRTVDVHIKRLRTRLHQTEAITIETVRGLGYRLEVKS